jgi:hypothetical protein
MELNPHPHAELFPLIEGDVFDALVEDIRENGLREPITLLNGQILDGRNRYFAMSEIDPEFSPATAPKMFVQFDGGDPLEWVISKNLHRRHLSASQRAVLAAEICRKKNKYAPGVSTGDTSRMLNVSLRTIARAKTLIQRDPDAAKAVKAGLARVGEEENRRTISVVLTDAEHQRCSLAAQHARMPLSTWMRDILLAEVDGARPEIGRWGATPDEAQERNDEIRAAREGGADYATLSKRYGLSMSRLSAILNHPQADGPPLHLGEMAGEGERT